MRFIDANFVGTEQPQDWLTFDDVLLLPQPSELESRNSSQISLETHLTSGITMKNPIISANMDTVTGADMAIMMYQKGCYGIVHRFHENADALYADLDKIAEKVPFVGMSIGLHQSELNILEECLKRYGKLVVCLDVAHGGMTQVPKQIRLINEHFADKVQIIAGNVADPVSAERLIIAGAHAIKVGVGPGCG